MNNIPHIVDTGASVMNKPVAYAMFRDGEYYDAIHPDEQAKTVGEYDIPLYTHPVKELTDEEILESIKKSDFPLAELSESAVRGMTNFAKAILRKAQEK